MRLTFRLRSWHRESSSLFWIVVRLSAPSVLPLFVCLVGRVAVDSLVVWRHSLRRCVCLCLPSLTIAAALPWYTTQRLFTCRTGCPLSSTTLRVSRSPILTAPVSFPRAAAVYICLAFVCGGNFRSYSPPGPVMLPIAVHILVVLRDDTEIGMLYV